MVFWNLAIMCVESIGLMGFVCVNAGLWQIQSRFLAWFLDRLRVPNRYVAYVCAVSMTLIRRTFFLTKVR